MTLRWLPAIGAGNGLWDGLIHLVLPGFAIGIGWVGYISRLVRASMLEILGENHVRMARSFGISEWRIVARYSLPLAILPTVTILGVGIAWLLSSAVFIEVVFARPGIGAFVRKPTMPWVPAPVAPSCGNFKKPSGHSRSAACRPHSSKRDLRSADDHA